MLPPNNYFKAVLLNINHCSNVDRYSLDCTYIIIFGVSSDKKEPADKQNAAYCVGSVGTRKSSIFHLTEKGY